MKLPAAPVSPPGITRRTLMLGAAAATLTPLLARRAMAAPTLPGNPEEGELNVWGGVPDPNLRGRPDLLGHAEISPSPDLAAYLDAKLPSACHLSTFTNESRYRWTKRFSAEELNRLTASLGIGEVKAMGVLERGVSGRAIRLALSVLLGATEIRGYGIGELATALLTALPVAITYLFLQRRVTEAVMLSTGIKG